MSSPRIVVTRVGHVRLYRAPDLHEGPGDVDLGYDALLEKKGTRLRVEEQRAPDWLRVTVLGGARYLSPEVDAAGRSVFIPPPSGQKWVRERDVTKPSSGGGVWLLLGLAVAAALNRKRG